MSNWVEVLSPDGRIFYYDHVHKLAQWQKPIAGNDGKAADASLAGDWNELKIWDGRSFFYNSSSKISVWSIPPELRTEQPLSISEAGPDDGAMTDLDINSSRHECLSSGEYGSRNSFWDLLRDKHIDESYNFSLAQSECQPDIRWEKVPTVDHGQQRFAEFLNKATRLKQQRGRDIEKHHVESMIKGLQSLTSITEASDYNSICAWGSEQSWWDMLTEGRRRALFEQYISDLTRVRLRDDRRRDEKYMNLLKKHIQSHPEVDYAAELDVVAALVGGCEPWLQLDDTQRLSVWRTCVAQHLREVRSSIAVGESLPRKQRELRKFKDTVRQQAMQLFSEGMLDIWTDTVDSVGEKLVSRFEGSLHNQTSLIVAEIIRKFLDNLRGGAEPFADILQPSSSLRDL